MTTLREMDPGHPATASGPRGRPRARRHGPRAGPAASPGSTSPIRRRPCSSASRSSGPRSCSRGPPRSRSWTSRPASRSRSSRSSRSCPSTPSTWSSRGRAGTRSRRTGRRARRRGPPGETACSLALANMTGANRLLIGIGWSMVVFIAWLRSRRQGAPVLREVRLERSHAVEVSFLALATVYSLTLPLKHSITLVDAVVLVGIFIAYTVRVSRAPASDPHLVGPARVDRRLLRPAAAPGRRRALRVLRGGDPAVRRALRRGPRRDGEASSASASSSSSSGSRRSPRRRRSCWWPGSTRGG